MAFELIRRLLQENDESLQTVDLKYENIGDTGAVALADALKINTSLKLLHLNRNSIGDTGAVALADALRQKMIENVETRFKTDILPNQPPNNNDRDQPPRGQPPNRFKKSKRGSGHRKQSFRQAKRGSARRVEKSPRRKSSKRSPVRVKRVKSSVRRRDLVSPRRVKKSHRRNNIKRKSKSGTKQ